MQLEIMLTNKSQVQASVNVFTHLGFEKVGADMRVLGLVGKSKAEWRRVNVITITV